MECSLGTSLEVPKPSAGLTFKGGCAWIVCPCRGELYHADFGEEKRFKTMLRNIRNHLSVYDNDPTKVKIVIVAHGAGVKFFMKDLTGSPWEKENIDTKAIEQELRDLNIYGVEPLICEITIKRLKLDAEKLYDFCKIVPSGVGAIGELQAKGYAYIKVQ